MFGGITPVTPEPAALSGQGLLSSLCSFSEKAHQARSVQGQKQQSTEAALQAAFEPVMGDSNRLRRLAVFCRITCQKADALFL